VIEAPILPLGARFSIARQHYSRYNRRRKSGGVSFALSVGSTISPVSFLSPKVATPGYRPLATIGTALRLVDPQNEGIVPHPTG